MMEIKQEMRSPCRIGTIGDTSTGQSTLWDVVQRLTPELMHQVHSAYGAFFPIEVRHYFAEWIEAQPWNNLSLDNEEHEPYAKNLVENLIMMVERQASELGPEDVLTRLKLNDTATQFREMYSNNPMSLVRVIRNCLATEQRLVQTSASGKSGDCRQASIHQKIARQFEELQRYTQVTESDLRSLQQKQESFVIQYQESVKIQNQLMLMANRVNGAVRPEAEQQLLQQKESVQLELSRKAQELLQLRLQLAEKHNEICKQLSALQNRILDDELIRWKRQQQLAGNGAPFEGNQLETLQQWCETQAELIWNVRHQINKVHMLRQQLPIDVPPTHTDLLPHLQDTITGLLSSIVTNTFVIEKQPPQVLKKDSKFTATVRLLVGGKLNVQMNPPTVKASIFSEEQARSLLKSDKNVKDETSGTILNHTGTMEYHQTSGQLAVTFRNMSLRSIKRSEKKGNETVTEEKFSVFFQSQFTIGGGELVFHVWTLSLPVVVTVHGNQECNALATVLWDNAFSEPGREPFRTPDKVQWPHLAEALNMKFHACTGRGLSHENLNYLASKLLDMGVGVPSANQPEDFSLMVIMWAQFNREPLPGRNFTFWEWFYAVLKLTKDSVLSPWKDNCIIGFVSKQRAQEMLTRCQPGTFLLRFSDSEVGGITIAWCAEGEKGERVAWNLAPFTDRDLKIRGIGDRIKDLGNLTYLYPDINKDQAFSKFWTNTQDGIPSAGRLDYVKSSLTQVIPGLTPQPQQMNYENPNTPQILRATSPSETSVSQPDTNMMERDATTDFPDFGTTDYNSGDIDEINVNELILNYPQHVNNM